jgi:hypothetical protein
MTIVLRLSDPISARVREQAARRSIDPENYVLVVVANALDQEDEEQVSERLRLLDSLLEMGDEEEQSDTFEFLRTAVDEDRLSNRPRFS